MSTRQVAFAGAVVGVLYAVTLSLRGDVAPGIVGGVLAAILAFLVIRRVEEYNAAKRRRMAARRDPPPG
jgi:hypothetical protein